MAAILTIRSGSNGGISPALNPIDVINAINRGDDIRINNQTAAIMQMGGDWYLNGQPVASFFTPPLGGSTMPTTAPTPAQVCSGQPLPWPLPTPPAALVSNLPANITLQTAPVLPPQPASASLPPPGCVTLVVGGRQRASSTVADMQAAITGGASVLRGDGSLAVIQNLTAPGWPAHNWLIDGNPITAVLGQGFQPGQLDLLHSLAAQGLTISPTLEGAGGVYYPDAPPPGAMPSPLQPILAPFPVTRPLGLATQVTGDNTWLWLLGGAALLFLLRRK